MKAPAFLTLFLLLSAHTATAQQYGCPYNLGYEGRCNGHVVEWCQDGQVMNFDCGPHGLTCGWVGSEGYDCSEENNAGNLVGPAAGQQNSPAAGNQGIAFGSASPAGNNNNNSGGCTLTSAKAPPTPPLWVGMGLCLLLLLRRPQPSQT